MSPPPASGKGQETSLWRRLFGDWSVYLEHKVPPGDLSRALEEASIPSGGFYFMLALSAGIATLGLIANSAAVIIGAMIIAPLMNPIISLSYASVRGKEVLMMRSLLTLFSGIALVIGVSFGATWLVGSRIVGLEIVSRTNPNLLDLGIAIGAGAAGAFALTRSKIGNAIPGVAVAVALVPPLCVTGIGLAFGTHAVVDPDNRLGNMDPAISMGSFLLFLTNLVAILLMGGVVFVTQGYGSWRLATLQIGVIVIALGIMIVPLTYSFEALYYRSKILSALRLVGVEKEKSDWSEVYLLQMDIDMTTDPVSVRLDVYAPEGVFGEEDLHFLEEGIEERIKQPLDIVIYLTEFKKLETTTGEELPHEASPESDESS